MTYLSIEIGLCIDLSVSFLKVNVSVLNVKH